MANTATATPERLRMGTKLAFGVGAISEAACYIAFTSFSMLFYNQVLGLSGTLCGLAVTIALVLDAVADPAIGFLSDGWRSKLGRRHPFLYAAPLPLLISFYCLFSPPEGLSGFPLFLWFTFFTLLFRQALSLYHVPHLALGAELTTDYRERSVVMSYNALFQNVGGAAAFFMGWTLFGAIEGGTKVRDGYPTLGITVGVIGAVVIFVSAHFTRDQIPRLHQPPKDAPRPSFVAFWRDILACLKNRNYLMLLLGLLCLSVATGTRETIHSYVSLFFWELPETKIRWFGLASPPAYVLAFVLVARLHSRFEKRSTIIGSGVIIVLATALPVLLRIAGLMPPNGAPSLFAILMLFVFAFYLGVATLMISVMSALADVADEHELETGRRQEGMFYAARTFFQQVSSGLGHLIAGIALDVIAFPTGAKPGEVAADTVLQLGVIDGPVGALAVIAGVAFYARYHISRRRHAEIQRELAERRATVVPAARAEAPFTSAEPAAGTASA